MPICLVCMHADCHLCMEVTAYSFAQLGDGVILTLQHWMIEHTHSMDGENTLYWSQHQIQHSLYCREGHAPHSAPTPGAGTSRQVDST